MISTTAASVTQPKSSVRKPSGMMRGCSRTVQLSASSAVRAPAVCSHLEIQNERSRFFPLLFFLPASSSFLYADGTDEDYAAAAAAAGEDDGDDCGGGGDGGGGVSGSLRDDSAPPPPHTHTHIHTHARVRLKFKSWHPRSSGVEQRDAEPPATLKTPEQHL